MNNVFVGLSNHTYEQLMGLLEQRNCGGKNEEIEFNGKKILYVSFGMKNTSTRILEYSNVFSHIMEEF
jgi:hypothetical protein